MKHLTFAAACSIGLLILRYHSGWLDICFELTSTLDLITKFNDVFIVHESFIHSAVCARNNILFFYLYFTFIIRWFGIDTWWRSQVLKNLFHFGVGGTICHSIQAHGFCFSLSWNTKWNRFFVSQCIYKQEHLNYIFADANNEIKRTTI